MRREFIWPIFTVLKSAGAKRGALIVAAAAAVSAGAAVGQTALTAATSAPKLSGIYAMAFTSFCQQSLSITQDGNTKVINVQFSGQDVSQHAGTGTFTPGKTTPTSGVVDIEGWKVSGALLKVNGGGDSYAGAAVSQPNVPYSLTPTSVTIGGVTYNAAVGHVTGGIIQQFTFVGLEPDNCSTSGVGIHQ